MHARYKLGLKFLHTWKTIKDSFLSKIYKTTFVDLFTLSNFASIHFFLKLCQLGDNWAEKNFGKYPTVEKRGWGGSVTIPPDQCSLAERSSTAKSKRLFLWEVLKRKIKTNLRLGFFAAIASSADPLWGPYYRFSILRFASAIALADLGPLTASAYFFSKIPS